MNYPLKTEVEFENFDYPDYQENTNEGRSNKEFLLSQDANVAKHNIDLKKVKSQLALIDAKPLTRLSLAHLLETRECLSVLPLASAYELLNRQNERYKDNIELVIFNIGTSSISEAQVRDNIQQLRLDLPNTPLVIISDRDDSCHILEALRYGVQGYIPTTLSPTVMIQALHLVRVGGTFVPSEMFFQASHLKSATRKHINKIQSESMEGFTPRQTEVLRLLRQGKSNKIIAYDLDMQESTVKVHVRQIMRKLKATNRTQAAFLAQQLFETEERQEKLDQLKIN